MTELEETLAPTPSILNSVSTVKSLSSFHLRILKSCEQSRQQMEALC
jgi:hypothetical protein